MHQLHRFRRICVAALAAACTLLPATAAQAHAELDSATPASGAVLDTAPASVVLQFNEQVRTTASTTSFVSPQATVTADVVVAGSVFTATPRTPLDDGAWSMFWQVESGDGHLVSGMQRFTVGSATDAPVGVIDAGGAASRIWVDRVLELIGWIGFVVALSAALYQSTGLYTAAAITLGAVLLRLLDMAEVLHGSLFRVGEARAAAMMGIAAALLMVSKRHALLLPAAIGAFAAQGLFSGHHRVDPAAQVLLLAHPLHLAGAALWSAALLGMLRAPSSATLTSKARHATIAVTILTPAVVVLAAATLLPLSTPGRWEWTVIGKTALTAAALALGWMNHRAIRRAPAGSATVRRRVAAEVALLVCVAVASASIATATPATAPDRDVAPSTAPQTQAQTLELTFDDGSTGRLELAGLAPTGRASAMLFYTPSTATAAEAATFSLASADAGVAGLTGSFLPMGDHLHGMFDLAGPGQYTATITVTVDTFTNVSATASFTVPDAPAPGSDA